MTRITLTLDQALAASLRDEAARDDRPMSSIARRAFRQYFTQQSRERLRAQTQAGGRNPGLSRARPPRRHEPVQRSLAAAAAVQTGGGL